MFTMDNLICVSFYLSKYINISLYINCVGRIEFNGGNKMS